MFRESMGVQRREKERNNNCSEEKMGANECREWEKAASSGVVGNRTPLHWCCDRGWLATAQLLITNGALVNATTKVRQSHHNNSYAISLSLSLSSIFFCKIPNHKNLSGSCICNCVSRDKREQKLSLRMWCVCATHLQQGDSALLWAAKAGHGNLVELLLRNGGSENKCG